MLDIGVWAGSGASSNPASGAEVAKRGKSNELLDFDDVDINVDGDGDIVEKTNASLSSNGAKTQGEEARYVGLSESETQVILRGLESVDSGIRKKVS